MASLGPAFSIVNSNTKTSPTFGVALPAAKPLVILKSADSILGVILVSSSSAKPSPLSSTVLSLSGSLSGSN